jgi:hypothetical protein
MLYKWTFWVYMDRINRTKGPIVMFMGHIGVPTKEARQRYVLYFISEFCVAPAMLAPLFTAGEDGYHIIASYAFPENNLKNLTC